MKAKKKSEDIQLTEKEIRKIEKELGVYIVKIEDPYRCPNQQFGIKNKDETYAGGIVAEDMYFTRESLIEKIKGLYKEE